VKAHPPSFATPALVSPEWSIVVPSYNSARYLPAALDSVLAQRPARVAELEVVDDRSTDDTSAVLQRYAEVGVRHHVNAENQGPVGNFNTCLRRATGDLVHLLHADDEVLPGFYARMGAAFEHDGVIAAVCRAEYIDEHGNPLTATRAEQETSGIWRRARTVLTVSNRVRPAAIVVRRRAYEVLGGFRPDLPHAADWEMWTRLAHHGDIWFENAVLARHRVHTASDTAGRIGTAANIAERAETIRLIAASYNGSDSWRLERQAMGYTALFAGRAAVRLARRRSWAPARAQAVAALRYGVGGVLWPGRPRLPVQLPADARIDPVTRSAGDRGG
jgi:glycosyltransferase involved in cell wall biosynthesis